MILVIFIEFIDRFLSLSLSQEWFSTFNIAANSVQ